jgi:hypothetical protein
MKLCLNKFRIGAFISALLVVGALPSQAQFGGVFTDPVQSGHALQQIAQQVKDSATWQQQLANTIKLLATADKDYQQAITTYNVINGNLKNFYLANHPVPAHDGELRQSVRRDDRATGCDERPGTRNVKHGLETDEPWTQLDFIFISE